MKTHEERALRHSGQDFLERIKQNPSAVATALWAVYLGVKAKINRPQAGGYNICEKRSNFRKELRNSVKVADSRDLLPGVAPKAGQRRAG
jgi:hypothetical protein